MRPDSETMKMSRIANHIRRRYGGSVTEDELRLVMHEHHVSPQKETYYRDAMLEWGYLILNDISKRYHITSDAQQPASFTVTIMPGMHNVKDARLKAVEVFARYEGVITVGEVQNDGE